MEWLADPQAWIAFVTLTALEIVLGVDNIIFISILVGRLPEHQRQRARVLGLAFAMLTRIGLLLSLAWVMTLTEPLFSIPVARQGDRGPRPDTDRRRPLPAVEERARDPQLARRRGATAQEHAAARRARRASRP